MELRSYSLWRISEVPKFLDLYHPVQLIFSKTTVSERFVKCSYLNFNEFDVAFWKIEREMMY